MKHARPPSPAPPPLRQRAEDKLRERRPATTPPRSPADTLALVHELEVHQIELEMQNEELHRAQVQAQQAAEKYADLFDFSPVGYFVLNPLGVIIEVSLAGAALLGFDRHRVLGQCFERYVVQDARAALSEFCASLRAGQGRRSCELRLLKPGGGSCDVLVEGIVAQGRSVQDQAFRLAATDITARKTAEENLRQLNAGLEQRVAERTADLRARNDELTRFNRGVVDRELRMVELKKEINELCRQTGLPPRYPVGVSGGTSK